ncbi:MFS-type transporter SLC18B1-like isoform X2 [Convolutriloba macropyga]|uniref:MFS-type transporter SLC18B1-like isoform X2 n=1 Tax=Convolutriloba macropyga TaxID=536237 RepID=UPI003F520546
MEKSGSFCRKFIALLLGLIFYLSEGVNYSLLGPFFPIEARYKHDTSTTFVGVITAIFDVGNLFAVFVFGEIIDRRNQKFVFCAGAFLSSTTTILFGAMGYTHGGGWPFIAMCMLVRAVSGVSCCMIWSCGLGLLLPLFPKWSGIVTSAIQCFLGVGQMIGPSLGSALYALGGYSLPFFVCGSVELVFFVLTCIFLPNTVMESIQTTNNINYKTLGTIEENGTGSETFENSSEELMPESKRKDSEGNNLVKEEERGLKTFPLQVAVSPYLKIYFGINGDTSGYYFLLLSAMYAIGSPVFGALADKGHGGKVFAYSPVFASFGFFLMYLPLEWKQVESPFWLLVLLGVQGLTGGASFVTGQLVFERMAYVMGFDDYYKVKVMSVSLSCACYSLGRIGGPIITGGVFMEHFGYYYSCLLQSLFLIIASVIGLVVCWRHGLLGKIYYMVDDCGTDVKAPPHCTSLYHSLSLSSSGAARNGSESARSACGRDGRESSSVNVMRSARHS